ncbi:hypothetical protein [Sphingomonas sp. S-NIH.Pt15_0812]|jgi:hypothetical protein|uniref:hypothetical protein n=1 Tax=Sphingomonas sp. S-NIH.Pt15_0812 TaxID=1920129 RepID=UPI000F7D6EA5|nr:hypothetical protein [Sphingomonas sp. S-NIH.Pt15_0812]RSU51002.1 hypothetical protein BRX43_08290 [Sphingomonas sp. S-NIH.Pt15_0812]
MIQTADAQAKCMTDDRDNQMAETPLPKDAEPHRWPSINILDALDMVEVGEIEIAFQRPLSHPRPATFD